MLLPRYDQIASISQYIGPCRYIVISKYPLAVGITE